jgi:hypothetical protein
MLAVGPAALYSVTIALRKKFSATYFWKDCVRYNATVRSTFFGTGMLEWVASASYNSLIVFGGKLTLCLSLTYYILF